MKASDKAGWLKSVIPFAAAWVGIRAYHASSLRFRILWYVVGLGLCLTAIRVIDWAFRKRVAQEKSLAAASAGEHVPGAKAPIR
jgi:hypothetical protein